jgi:DNA-3-methyladenine glycosylase I
MAVAGKELDRCPWCGDDPLYVRYHDLEWGYPLRDEGKHFEFLLLETFQAGLSWITILRKREAFRAAFAGFDPERVARFGDRQRARLMADPGIIRNGQKIDAAVSNAKAFLEVRAEFGSFDSYVWGFTGGKPFDSRIESMSDMPARTELSDDVSADMKRRGFKFVGSVTIYAHLQAIGVVNDHLVSCFRHDDCAFSTGR